MTPSSPARNFHTTRRAFIMMPNGLLVAPKNTDISHEQILKNRGVASDEVSRIMAKVPRGYFMNNEIVVYQGYDMTPGAIWCLDLGGYQIARSYIPNLRREFSINDNTRVWMGVRVGKIGTVWETLYPTTIGALSR